MILETSMRDVLTSLSGLIGLGGFGVGLYQYYRAQVWKKSEFAAAQLQRLTDDPDLALCCVFLDWGERKIPVPERYKVFTANSEVSFKHDWDSVKQALTPENKESNFNFPLVLYRDLFDKFLVYLEGINFYLSRGLFKVDDVCSLKYWLDELRRSRYLKGEDQKVFMKFIDHYHYEGVKSLMKKLDKHAEKEVRRLKPR